MKYVYFLICSFDVTSAFFINLVKLEKKDLETILEIDLFIPMSGTIYSGTSHDTRYDRNH